MDKFPLFQRNYEDSFHFSKNKEGKSAIYIFSNKINTYWLHITIILLSLWKTLRIMAQSALTIRLDSDLKMQFDSLCEEFGMSTNTAFNIYVRQVVRSRRIPFAIEAPAKDDIMNKGRAAFYEMRQTAADAGIQDMSLDEINEEIRLARESK